RLHDLPVDVEPAACELQRLYELGTFSQIPAGRVLQPGVDRDPLPESPRIHHDVVHALGVGVDLDRALHPHRAASSSRPSQSASACSTALSNEWIRNPKSSRAASFLGKRSRSKEYMRGRTSSTGWSTIALTTALASGVADAPRRTGVRPTPIRS